MFKGIILSNTKVKRNTNLPLIMVKNTGSNAEYDATNDIISIVSGGSYDIFATIVATSISGGTITAQLYGNEIAIPGAVSTITVGATETATFTLFDNEKIEPTRGFGYTDISIRFDADVVINDAMVIIKKTI